eukprot:TRINITY_DN38032_c0_g2_i1.p1 TRINITY_DN38032_c0_g2~~TRINITY_DN38032_c0_g2_i1.p1  ORF type:complete len:320 (-),score=77.47 TRINITY_DN38032_c0_g2_i1:960-1919(-)
MDSLHAAPLPKCLMPLQQEDLELDAVRFASAYYPAWACISSQDGVEMQPDHDQGVRDEDTIDAVLRDILEAEEDPIKSLAPSAQPSVESPAVPSTESQAVLHQGSEEVKTLEPPASVAEEMAEPVAQPSAGSSVLPAASMDSHETGAHIDGGVAATVDAVRADTTEPQLATQHRASEGQDAPRSSLEAAAPPAVQAVHGDTGKSQQPRVAKPGQAATTPYSRTEATAEAPIAPSRPQATMEDHFFQAVAMLPPEELQEFAKDHVETELKQIRALPRELRARAFRGLAAEWHPDKCPAMPDFAKEVFQQLQAQKKTVLDG